MKRVSYAIIAAAALLPFAPVARLDVEDWKLTAALTRAQCNVEQKLCETNCR
jgi:hypothetical protein